jgi:hypothetical protein
MIRTRRELLDQFVEFMGEAADPIARNLAENLLDRALETVWQYRTWRQFIMPTPYTLTTIANQGLCALPPYFGRVSGKDGILRNLTTGARVDPIGLEQLQETYPTQGTPLEVAGVPFLYAIGGSVGVSAQPAAGDLAVEALSSSVADTTVVVELSGLSSTGVYTRTQVTLTGVVAVALGSWSQILTASKTYPSGQAPTTPDTTSEGTVTFRTVVGLVTLQTLLPIESAREQVALILYPKPATVQTYAVPIYRRPWALSKDADALPDHWDPALFEEMGIQWRVNSGELSADGANPAMRPKLADLVAFENLSAPRAVVRPFQW